MALTLALVAVGCGSSDDSPSNNAGSTPQGDSRRNVVSFTDDVGRTVELEIPVRRAVAFNNYTVEFVRAIGAFGSLVALSDGDAREASYWRSEATITAGDQGEPNWESVVSVDPEVVILPRNGAWEQAVQRLEPFGIKVLVVTGWDEGKHQENVSTLARVFDRPAEGQKFNAFHARYRDMLSQRLGGVTPKPVYWEAAADFQSPVPGSGWHDMIQTGGGRNIFGDITFGQTSGASTGSVHSFPIDPEAVLLRQPEMIVKLHTGSYEPPNAGVLDASINKMLGRPGWGDLPAVRNRNVHTISRFTGGAVSKVVGALYVAKWLHPTLFTDVNPDQVFKEWIETYQGVPLPDPTRYRASIGGA